MCCGLEKRFFKPKDPNKKTQKLKQTGGRYTLLLTLFLQNPWVRVKREDTGCLSSEATAGGVLTPAAVAINQDPSAGWLGCGGGRALSERPRSPPLPSGPGGRYDGKHHRYELHTSEGSSQPDGGQSDTAEPSAQSSRWMAI